MPMRYVTARMELRWCYVTGTTVLAFHGVGEPHNF